LIKEERILKNKNKLSPYKKLSVFYNTCLKTFRSHLVYGKRAQISSMPEENSTASLVAEKPPSPGKKTLAEVTKNENL
jgi:hypothetical protein